MISTIAQRTALFALTLVLAVGSLTAQPGTGDRDGRGPGRGDGQGGGDRAPQGNALLRCLGTLDLTDSQKETIESLKHRAENATSAIRETIEGLNHRLRAAHEAGDREAAAAIMAEIKAQHEALAAIEKGLMDAILGTLTPEQTAALRACMNGKGDRDDHGRGGRGEHGDKRQDCFAQLDLTREQHAEIKSLHESFRSAHADEMAEIRELHRLLRDARRAGEEEKVARLRAAIEQKMTALKAAQARLHAAILGVLTPEQLARLEACNEGRGDRDKGRRRGGIANPTVPQLD